MREHTSERSDAISSGTRLKPGMRPNTVRVLREEFGIDISDQHPRHLDAHSAEGELVAVEVECRPG